MVGHAGTSTKVASCQRATLSTRGQTAGLHSAVMRSPADAVSEHVQRLYGGVGVECAGTGPKSATFRLPYSLTNFEEFLFDICEEFNATVNLELQDDGACIVVYPDVRHVPQTSAPVTRRDKHRGLVAALVVVIAVLTVGIIAMGHRLWSAPTPR